LGIFYAQVYVYIRSDINVYLIYGFVEFFVEFIELFNKVV